MTEDEMAGQHHRLNGHEFEQALGDGKQQGNLACCSLWGHKELNTTKQLNNNNNKLYSTDKKKKKTKENEKLKTEEPEDTDTWRFSKNLAQLKDSEMKSPAIKAQPSTQNFQYILQQLAFKYQLCHDEQKKPLK